MTDDKKNFKVAFEEIITDYMSTFGRWDIRFDTDSLNDNDVPVNALIEIWQDEKVMRASIEINKLHEIVSQMKQKIDDANYPKWLDERPTHMMTNGTLLRVDEVRFHPEHGMFAAVSIFNPSMQMVGKKILEISGKTDRKALARKLGESEDYDDELINACGYVIWRAKE